MARLSIVIPVVGDLNAFETTLASVLQHRPDDCEVIAALGVKYADPYDLAGEVRFVELPATRRWTQAMRGGMAAAVAPILHVIEPGVEATDGWTEPALQAIESPAVGAVTPTIVEAGRPDRVLARGLRYTAGGRRRVETADRDDLIGPTRYAAFYRRLAVAEVGGPCDRVGDHMADVDLALALREAGWRSASAPQCVVTAAAELLDAPARSFAAGLHAERLYRRHLPRQSGKTVAKLAHAAAVAGELLSLPLRPGSVLQLTGRLVARMTTAQRPASDEMPAAQKTPPTQTAPAVDVFHESQRREAA